MIDAIYSLLKKEVKYYKVPVVDLIAIQSNDPFKVLISALLSARTKDEVTLKAAERLFSVVKNADDLEKIPLKTLEKIIYPVGFYKTKSKNLMELPSVLRKEFNGNIPSSVEELILLPGVGRKTANLVVGAGFGKPAICVDTHVHRILNRIGYVKTKNPQETENALRKKLPHQYWISINSILVAYGQHTCVPISPFCSRCPIERYCKKIGVVRKR